MPPEREGKEEQEGPVSTVRPWEPPKSPFGLLQETYYTSPWRLLVVSILLNVTSGRHQVRPVVGDLFDRYPSPEAMAEADEEELAGMIRRLGLYRKRAKALVDFSRTYLDSPPWRTPAELKYFGKYADDSYRLFCLGEWRQVRPRDKKLKQYRDWLFAHYGAEKSESELEEEHEWAEQEVRRKQRMREAREQKKEERKRARAATLNPTELEASDFGETGMDDTEDQSIAEHDEEDVPRRRRRKERKTKKRRAPDEVKADPEEETG